MLMLVEDNGKSVEVSDPILQYKLRFLVTRGEDGRYHPNYGVTWERIENELWG